MHSTSKGQIKPKADWRAIDPQKKGTNEFRRFCREKQKTKLDSFVCWKNLRRDYLLMDLSDL